jgi:hypothetical protein
MTNHPNRSKATRRLNELTGAELQKYAQPYRPGFYCVETGSGVPRYYAAVYARGEIRPFYTRAMPWLGNPQKWPSDAMREAERVAQLLIARYAHWE